MISKDLEAQILRLHHVERWPVGTIAVQLGVHPDAVERVIAQEGTPRPCLVRPSMLEPYLPFIEETLRHWPGLRASRLYDMCVGRGYRGGPTHFRHRIRGLRPRPPAEAYLRLATLPGEQAQVDWGHFGEIAIGRSHRPLMGFVMVLSWSRRIYLRYFLGAQLGCFLRGHVGAFEAFGGLPRTLLYDNLKCAVLERMGDAIRFHPTLLALARHYRFEPRPVAVARGNEKGRVERAIRFVRDSFFAARCWKDLADLNEQARVWCEGRAGDRPWPQDHARTVREAFEEERGKLLPLPATSFPSEETLEAKVGKTPYVRFDGNDYSVPHDRVRRILTVVANDTLVRVLEGLEEVARHGRTYDRGREIEDPSHLAALLEEKRRARKGRATGRLVHAAPTVGSLLEELARRGENLGSLTCRFVELLDLYGAERLERASREALERGAPHPRSVGLILERERKALASPPIVAVELPEDPRVRGIAVRPHALETYDTLAASSEEEGDEPAAE